MTITLSGQNGETFPTWTTATRPATPNQSQMGFNTTTGALDVYNGSSWTSIPMPTSQGSSGQYLQSAGAGAAPTWGSAGLSTQSVQTSNFTASAGNIYPVNTASGAITITLPSSPVAGNQIVIVDYGSAATNNITINTNGNKLQGSSASAIINQNYAAVNYVYVDSTKGWLTYAGYITTTTNQTYSASYLIIAGGGGGGGSPASQNGSGGGGAGGFLSGTLTFTAGTTYTATVGGGGSGATAGQGSNGSNSSFSPVGTTAIGGGGGSYSGNSGNSGGSGGGSGGGGGSPGSGTSGQGNSAGNRPGNNALGGGGGGAGSAGSSQNGGSGAASSITGSSVTYAGGGGGGGNSSGGGSGGSGGGGNGGTENGSAPSNGGAGTIYTGSGGGGGSNVDNGGQSTGGNGGSGVVIISVPTTSYSGVTTGSPTVTTSGTNTIIKFTSSGSYTA